MAAANVHAFADDLKAALTGGSKAAATGHHNGDTIDLAHFAFLLSHQLMPANDKFHPFYRQTRSNFVKAMCSAPNNTTVIDGASFVTAFHRMVVKDATFADDAWTIANIFRAQITHDGIKVKIHLNCQTATLILLDYWRALLAHNDTHNPTHGLTTAHAPSLAACISLDHAWICITPHGAPADAIATHYNIIEQKAASIVIDWSDRTLFLPLLNRSRCDNDGGLHIMAAATAERTTAVTLARRITVTSYEFMGVMCETFLRESLDHLHWMSTSPAELHRLVACMVAILSLDEQLQLLHHSSNIWYMIADMLELPSLRLARSSQLRGAYVIALQPLMMAITPLLTTLVSADAIAMAKRLTPSGVPPSGEWSAALLCYCQSMSISVTHYNYRPRVRLEKMMSRLHISHINDITAGDAATRLVTVEQQSDQLLTLCRQLEGKSPLPPTPASSSASVVDEESLTVAINKFLHNLWQFAVFPQTSAKATKKAPSKRAAAKFDDASSSATPAAIPETKSDGKPSSGGTSSSNSEMYDALLELDRCRTLLGAAAVIARAKLVTNPLSTAEATTVTNDDGDAVSTTADTTTSVNGHKRKLTEAKDTSTTKKSRGGATKSKTKLELFSVDQVEAERQKGDAGFLNENATLLRATFKLIRDHCSDTLDEYLTSHAYVHGLLVQARILDGNMQDWAKHETSVFVCLTCTLPSARSPSSTGVGAGICGACADACHRVLSHKVVCIGKKSHFTCDCGRLDRLSCACLRTSSHHACAATTILSFSSSSLSSSSSAAASSAASPTSGNGVATIGWFAPLPPSTNRYNHNYDTPPSYCYVRRAPAVPSSSPTVNGDDDTKTASSAAAAAATHSNDGDVEGGCRFDNSGDADVMVALPVIVDGDEEMERFSAAAVVQCTTCEDWFHPRCTFDEREEIDAALAGEPFTCNDCDDLQESTDDTTHDSDDVPVAKKKKPAAATSKNGAGKTKQSKGKKTK